MSDVRLIQVPWYLGREHADLSRGPGKLADAIGGESVVIERPRPYVTPNEIDESFAVIRSVAATVRETVEEGRFPLVLAVNCFTSLGPWPASAAISASSGSTPTGTSTRPTRRRPGSSTDGARNAARRRLARTAANSRGAANRPRRARACWSAPATSIQPSRTRVSASALRQADAETLEDAFEELSREVDAVYVHIDLDVIDPSVARANALSVEGGFGAEELEQALTAISSRFEIAAAAMTAYDPSVDPEGRVPPIAARLARQLVPEKVAR